MWCNFFNHSEQQTCCRCKWYDVEDLSLISFICFNYFLATWQTLQKCKTYLATDQYLSSPDFLVGWFFIRSMTSYKWKWINHTIQWISITHQFITLINIWLACLTLFYMFKYSILFCIFHPIKTTIVSDNQNKIIKNYLTFF